MMLNLVINVQILIKLQQLIFANLFVEMHSLSLEKKHVMMEYLLIRLDANLIVQDRYLTLLAL